MANMTLRRRTAMRGGNAIDWESVLRDVVEGNGTDEFVFPSNMTKLRQYGLYGTKYSTVIIPDSVTISPQREYSFLRSCTNLTHVEFGSGLTRIDESFCSGCTALESVTIPVQITAINYYAFGGCTHLAEVICLPTTPPTLSAAALSNSGITAIYVPDASVATYKAANNWSTYASIIKGISERPTT